MDTTLYGTTNSLLAILKQEPLLYSIIEHSL